MPIALNSTQLQQLESFLDSRDFPEAYRYLADINDNTPGSDSRTSIWLEAAAESFGLKPFRFYRSLIL